MSKFSLTPQEIPLLINILEKYLADQTPNPTLNKLLEHLKAYQHTQESHPNDQASSSHTTPNHIP